MNEPSTCTPCFWNCCSRSVSASPDRLKPLYTSFSPSGVTDSMPTSAPLIRALRIASRYSGSSAASMVIWVKNTMSDGSFDIRSISSKRSSRMALRLSYDVRSARRSAIARSCTVTG